MANVNITLKNAHSVYAGVVTAPLLTSKARYAARLMFEAENGETAEAELKVTDINADTRKSAPRACYEAELDGGMLPGLTVTAARLVSGDGEIKAEFALEPFLKAENKIDCFLLDISLALDGDACVCLFGGKNPLIRYLLGAEALGELTAVCGAFNLTERCTDFEYKRDLVIPAHAEFTDGALYLTAVTEQGTKEVIFESDQKPMLRRFLWQDSTKMSTYTSTGDSRFTAPLMIDDVSKVVNIRIGATFSTDGRYYPCYKSIVKENGAIDLATGRDTVIKGSALYNYVGISDGREVYVYKDTDGALELYKHISKEPDEDFFVAGDGTIAVTGTGPLKMYIYDGRYIEVMITFERSPCEFIREVTDRYAFAYMEGSLVRVASVSPYGNIVKYSYEFESGADTVFATSIIHMIAAGKNGSRFGNVSTESVTAQEYLDSVIAEKCANKKFFIGDGFLCAYGNGVEPDEIYPYENTADVMTIPKSARAKIFRDLIVIKENGVNKVYMYSRVTSRMEKLEGDLGAGEVIAVAKLGDRIIAADQGGHIFTYLLSRQNGYIFHTKLPGKSGLTRLYERIAPFDGAQNVRVSFGVTLAAEV